MLPENEEALVPVPLEVEEASHDQYVEEASATAHARDDKMAQPS